MPKILILSSNPRRDLNLDREVSDLTTAIQRLGKFEIALGLGVRSQELPGLFVEHSPQVVHFCGHGAGEQGLLFQDENGQERLVSTEVLARLFKTFKDEINCVVLNACDSDQQSEAIVEYINYVVGMSQPILDKAAYYFATGFYQGVGAGKSIEQSYELGCIAIQLWSEANTQSTQTRQYRKAEYVGSVTQLTQPNLPEHLKPVLRKKNLLLTSAADCLVQAVPFPSSTSSFPPGFEEVIRQEIDRKDYKDQARTAYDHFGQFSAENAVTNLTKTEYAQRKILVGKVKQFWIEGFLKPSLRGINAINLDLKASPEAIANLAQGIETLAVELDSSYERLKTTQIYEEIGQGRTLLILGSPGAGKTIALLQLTQRLIDRSEQNLSLPMPIVFNLSSWAKDRKSIVDWLIDELQEKYQVPKSLSEPWIGQQQLILLLDGLDEVREEHRSDCVRVLNEFIRLFPQTEIAVCSRVRDYEALTERLQISSALCLQPLSSKEVYEFLDSVGGSLAGLKALLKRNSDLEQFAQTPLILNLMSSAYQGWSAERLMQELRSTADRTTHLFDTYIDCCLERGSASDYSKNQVLSWLSWLACRMLQKKQTVFLIEKLQPNWLQNLREEKDYQIRYLTSYLLITAMISGLIYGLLLWLPLGLFAWLFGCLLVRLFIWFPDLIVRLTYGPIKGPALLLSEEILPVEKISWSWQRAKSRLMHDFFADFSSSVGFRVNSTLGTLLTILFFGLAFVLLLRDHGLSGSLNFVLLSGLLIGLFAGLVSSEIEHQVVSNQGIRRSGKNCLMIGLLSGLLFGLLSRLFAGLLIGLFAGSILGLLYGSQYGGKACIQHLTLRYLLYQKRRIPWNYARFLDFASDRLLMKKIGGGYVFFHRMLLEHFAEMNPDWKQPRKL